MISRKFNLILESNTPPISENELVNIKFEDDDGVHNTKCQLTEFGWGIDRSKIYHRFKIIDSDSLVYVSGAEFNLPMDFNDKVNSFLFYPFYNESLPRLRAMREFIRKSYIIIEN